MRVGQIEEKRLQLLRGQHALIEQCPRRQGGEVGSREFGALAQTERLSIQFDTGGPARVSNEELPEGRHRGECGGSDHRGIDGNGAPSKDF